MITPPLGSVFADPRWWTAWPGSPNDSPALSTWLHKRRFGGVSCVTVDRAESRVVITIDVPATERRDCGMTTRRTHHTISTEFVIADPRELPPGCPPWSSEEARHDPF
jgi:hypothetical protein